MNDLGKTFRKLKEQGEGALIGYITCGDPEPKYTPGIAEALIEGGVDILELGIPFSDPIADGPTIQAASVRALNAGTTPKMVLEIAREIRKEHDVPLVVLTYYNPIFRMGLDNFLRLANNCGVSGLIIPDLPVDEAEDYKKIAETYAIDTIFLAAPSTSAKRLQKILEFTSGFLYLVSLFGVTGVREKVEDSTIQLIKKILPSTNGRIPLAVGFGISKPEHVKRIIENGADGIIVGSAFVNIINKNKGNPSKMLREIKGSVQELKKATLRNQVRGHS
jgi:tryptophan synthase alpha chain